PAGPVLDRQRRQREPAFAALDRLHRLRRRGRRRRRAGAVARAGPAHGAAEGPVPRRVAEVRAAVSDAPAPPPLTNPPEEERLPRGQLQRLGAYGWVDRDAGVIHLPIQRAMDEVVQELSRGGESP